VVLDEEQRHLVGRGGQRLDLLEHVEAVGLLVDEPLDPARLPLDPFQAVDELAAVLRVRVTEVGGGRIGLHTGWQYAERPNRGQTDAPADRATMLPMTLLDRHELISPLERALVVISHPDDGEFGAAATIAQLTRAGVRVDYVVTTDGSKGTEDPEVTPAQLAATRMAEQRAAADMLGVGEIVHLGHPDGYLRPTLDLRRDITRQIRRFRPDLVMTQSPQRRLDHNPYIGHPDHLATGEATLAAVYPAARDHLHFPELWTDERLEPWKVRQVLLMGVEEPNLWLDVADTFEIGLRAILAHASQMDGDDVAERVRERARLAGEPQGIGLAQAFLSIVLDR
jgi:LmbE family N-acetylglucosaminyl deacetylase